MSFNNNIYNINFKKLATWLVPQTLRKPRLIGFILVLVSPFVYLHSMMLRFRDSIIYRLTITPQVVYLEKMLNDRYDSTDRRIFIQDGKEYPALYLYKKDEGVSKAKYLFRKSEGVNKAKYLYTKGEAGINTFDFIVFVPINVLYNVNEMIALINSYKLAGKKYKIQNL